jgi:non-specific serine/threonine protein kinase
VIGRELAHYRITARLGEGGMGVVYRARDGKLDRDVALKVLPEAAMGDPERVERFTREAKIVAGLSHPNIVTLHSVEEADGVHFLTMELVDGKTLDRLIPRGGLDLDRLFELAIPIADAVAAAHEAGVTHRDLKPANVMVTRDGRVKVLDFGLARLEAGAPKATEAMTEAITQQGMVVGTAHYMSPEQARGEAVDARSDIFSLGALLYEMVTGRRPFTGKSSAELVSAILRDDPPPVSEIKEELPYHLGRIVQRCLEKDPRKRYQAALDVRNELEGLEREVDSGVSRPSSGSVPAARGRSRRDRRWVLAGAALAAALAVGLVVLAPWRDAGREAGGAGAPGAAAEAARRMLVVLPFENLGPAEDAYFAAGMTEELTSRLARVSGLGVISRSSAQRYADTELPLRRIGDELGVDYVVEGTVRWAKGAAGGSRVRITPQLVRVADDTQLWSSSFERDLEDVFAIQAEIAGQVIDELGVTLLAPERAAVEGRPTENMEAYQAWLRGNEHWDIAGFDPEEFALAAGLYARAAALDPEFLEPLADLVSVHGVLYHGSRDPEHRERMADALERAEALAPESPVVELARGTWAYYVEEDYPAAFAHYETAQRALPNDAEPLQLMAFIRRRQGRLEEAVELLGRVRELSPRDAHTRFELGRTLEALRRFEAADAAYAEAIGLEPDNVMLYSERAFLQVAWKGDLDAALEIARAAPQVAGTWGDTPVEELDFLRRRWTVLRDRIEPRLDTAPDPAVEARDRLELAFAYRALGEDARARAVLEAALARLRGVAETAPDNLFGAVGLALAEAMAGNREAALAALARAEEAAGPDRFVFGPMVAKVRARVLAELGDHDRAVELLEELVRGTYGEPVTVPLLRLDPAWEPLREHPGFRELVAER